MKYLILEVTHDTFYEEYRYTEPITMCNNWKKWYKKNKENLSKDFHFEVYERKGNKFELIKDEDTPMEKGMAFCYWNRATCLDEPPTKIIYKYPNLKWTDDDPLPDEIKEYLEKANSNSIMWSTHSVSFEIGYKYYAFDIYRDNSYGTGC